MDNEINTVRTCLDEIEKKGDVSNKDLARAMRSFVTNCYAQHVNVTMTNSSTIKQIAEDVKPIADWIKPQIEREKLWKEKRQGVMIHVMQWGIIICIGWIGLVFGEGVRALVTQWLTK